MNFLHGSMDIATSASKLFTWPSVARSTSIIIFVIVLLYHCIVASLWLAACCLMLGQAPPARAEAIVISDLTQYLSFPDDPCFTASYTDHLDTGSRAGVLCGRSLSKICGGTLSKLTLQPIL